MLKLAECAGVYAAASLAKPLKPSTIPIHFTDQSFARWRRAGSGANPANPVCIPANRRVMVTADQRLDPQCAAHYNLTNRCGNTCILQWNGLAEIRDRRFNASAQTTQLVKLPTTKTSPAAHPVPTVEFRTAKGVLTAGAASPRGWHFDFPARGLPRVEPGNTLRHRGNPAGSNARA